MLFWTYNTLLLLATPFLSLYIACRALLKNKRALRSFFVTPITSRSSSPTLWIHAVSLGEVNTTKPLIEALRLQYPSHKIYLSTMTETGFAAAQRLESVESFYLPLDVWFLQRSLIKKIRPECVVYVEGDVWPSLTHELYKAGVRQVIVSAKISARSCTRLTKLPLFIPFFYRHIDLFCAQDSAMIERFLSLGIDRAKIQLTGNLKLVLSKDLGLDPSMEHKLETFLTLDPEKKTLIIACTHEGEEALLLKLLKTVLSRFNVIIAPRHPARFLDVEHLLKNMDLDCSVFSHPSPTQSPLFLIDAIGLLGVIYKKADVTILGGSFIQGVGGHNVMEPIFKGCPVIVGPYMETQGAPLDLMLTEHLGLQCQAMNLLEAIDSVFEDEGMKSRVRAFRSHKNAILENSLKCLCLE